MNKGHAVICRGLFGFVRDDEGHEYPRGECMAMCKRTYE